MSNAHYELNLAQSVPAGPVDRSAVKLLYVSTARYGGDWHSILHTHACTEFFYVVGGAGQFRVENHYLPVMADQLVIIPPNVMHTELSLDQHPLEYVVLGVEGLELADGGEGEDRCMVVDFKGCGEEILFYLRAILREIERKEQDYEAVCRDLLDILLVRYRRRAHLSLATLPADPGASKECAMVRRYLEDHFKENITLDALADMAHVNKYHMVHTFSKTYGISPINYLIARRIHESCYLLSGTDHSLSQIAHMLGFSSPSYFSQSFRKLEGTNPMEYRKAHKASGPYERRSAYGL